MAQVLREEIRENILKAAMQEFFDKGYQSAAMRNIAEFVGNWSLGRFLFLLNNIEFMFSSGGRDFI